MADPMSEKPNPYRTPPPTGPTPRGAKVAARTRSAWRAFWTHRGEEASSVADFLEGHFGFTLGMTAITAILAIAACVVITETASDDECATRCDSMRAASSIRDRGCYCVDDNGKPWAWDEWPGVDR